MESDISSKILEWLDKHGYPFEMTVASIFQKNGFQIGQSVYYIDNELKIPREVDVIAFKTFQIDSHFISFSFVIECKSTKSKPWISFSNGSKREFRTLPNYKATKYAKRLLSKIKKTKQNSELFSSRNDNYGYSMTLALRDGDATDIFYKAIQTLTKAVDHYVDKFASNNNLLYFYFPVIALDCPLFELKLLENGETELVQIQQSAYLSRNPKDNNLDSSVDILTKPSIAEYAKFYSKAITRFMSSNKNEIKKFIEEINKPFG
ncbi:MAG TPA: hypothetical protein VGN00_29245 [Puia sp.]|jgi:hypothetical protein